MFKIRHHLDVIRFELLYLRRRSRVCRDTLCNIRARARKTFETSIDDTRKSQINVKSNYENPNSCRDFPLYRVSRKYRITRWFNVFWRSCLIWIWYDEMRTDSKQVAQTNGTTGQKCSLKKSNVHEFGHGTPSAQENSMNLSVPGDLICKWITMLCLKSVIRRK